jgi:hypothetical protein
MPLKKWSLEENEIIKKYWNIPMRDLLEKLPGRNSKTIYWKISQLGENRQTYKRYTVDEDVFIKANYKTIGNFEIGRKIKRTAKSISKRMIVLGLRRNGDDFKELAKSNRGCYKKGCVSKIAFPLGVLQLVYDSKLDRHFYNIKTEKGFVRFSRYLYELFNNEKLKDTDIVFHADGNSLNLLKENLIKITRKQLLYENNFKDEAFVKRIFRIQNPELIDNIIKNHHDLIQVKKQSFLLNKKIKENDISRKA